MLKHPGGIITVCHFGTKLHFCFQRSIIFMNGSKGGLRKYVLNFWPHTLPSIFALPGRSQSSQLISLRYLAVTFSKSRGFSHRHFADAWELLLRHLPRECGVGFAQKVIIRFFPSAHHSLDPKGVFQLNVGTMPACIPAIPEFYRSIMLCIIWRELIGRMQ